LWLINCWWCFFCCCDLFILNILLVSSIFNSSISSFNSISSLPFPIFTSIMFLFSFLISTSISFI
jgi:hypothetical protein